MCLKHRKRAILICENFICTENRIICYVCLKEMKHNKHTKDLLDYDEMI